MPIELQSDGETEPDPGQEVYESLSAVASDADDLTLMGLLAALQRGESWERVPPRQRELCAALESELFEAEE